MFLSRVLLGGLIAFSASSASILQTQFLDKSSGLGFAVSSVQNQSAFDVALQIAAPAGAGWGAVGTGDRMDGSLMFIIYPSGSTGVSLSVRTAHGHDTPNVITAPNIFMQSSQISNGMMTANILCYNCTDWTGGRGLSIRSKNQPWIWATGPGQDEQGQDSQDKRSNNQVLEIEKHSKYGTFTVDMTKTIASASTPPAISGSSNSNTKTISGSVAILVIIHAICLGGAFVLLFPLGIILLRGFGSIRFHWILQLFASSVCIVGVAVAIVFSVRDPEYKGLDEGHQIIGIVVVVALFLQAVLGYLHHTNFMKKQRRTWASYLHLWTGRAIIIIGMLNAILGFILSGNSIGAAAVGAVSAVILIGMWLMTWFVAKRARSKSAPVRQVYQLPLSNRRSSQQDSEDALWGPAMD